MNLLRVFESISIQLVAQFRKSAEIKHSGGMGSVREDALKDFLKEYLPRKYGVGSGEVITSDNVVSGQLDAVIYDNDHCPLFLHSSSHSLFPVESVYGAISIKSNLDSTELKDAYANIRSLKKILSRQGFSHKPTSGMFQGMAAPVPVTAIVAYAANRSLEAIAKQVKELDAELEDLFYRPDFVVVIGLGLIGPREKLRGDFNKYELPRAADKLCELRATGRHTLLRTYMQILDELNSIQLKPLDLQSYFDMPRLEGEYRVRRHDKFMIKTHATGQTTVKKLGANALKKIVEGSKQVTLRQHYENAYGSVPQGAEKLYDLNTMVYEYNPKNSPPLTQAMRFENGEPVSDGGFYPYSIEIDGRQYLIDMNSFIDDDDFEDNPDVTVNELMSI